MNQVLKFQFTTENTNLNLFIEELAEVSAKTKLFLSEAKKAESYAKQKYISHCIENEDSDFHFDNHLRKYERAVLDLNETIEDLEDLRFSLAEEEMFLDIAGELVEKHQLAWTHLNNACKIERQAKAAVLD